MNEPLCVVWFGIWCIRKIYVALNLLFKRALMEKEDNCDEKFSLVVKPTTICIILNLWSLPTLGSSPTWCQDSRMPSLTTSRVWFADMCYPHHFLSILIVHPSLRRVLMYLTSVWHGPIWLFMYGFLTYLHESPFGEWGNSNIYRDIYDHVTLMCETLTTSKA